jgi:hypothetical protein
MNIANSYEDARKDRAQLSNIKISDEKKDKTVVGLVSSYETFLPRVGYFLIFLFTIITSTYISELLSCQFRYMLTTNMYARHYLALLMLFFFIMGLGGWSFDSTTDKLASNSWSSGNAIDSLIMAFTIYIIFLISSKSKLVPNLIFLGSLFLLYVITAQRNYWSARNMISVTGNSVMINSIYILSVISVASLFYGFINYIYYQKSQYGDEFNLLHFIFGGQKCASLENDGYGGKRSKSKKH